MFEWIAGTIERLGYTGVVVLTFLENLFPPIPSEVVVPLAGYVAAEGKLTIGAVIVAASAGSMAGAAFWYGVGRKVGEHRLRAWVERFGKWLTLSPADLERAQAWFDRHGRSAVFIGRLIPGVRTFISLPAGFSQMPLGTFLLFSVLGTVLWTSALAYAGVVLRASYGIIGDYMDVATYAVLGTVGVLLVRRYIRCWKAPARS